LSGVVLGAGTVAPTQSYFLRRFLVAQKRPLYENDRHEKGSQMAMSGIYAGG